MTLNSRLARLEERQVEPEAAEAEAEAARAELERRLLGPAVSTAVCEAPAWAVEMWPKLFGELR